MNLRKMTDEEVRNALIESREVEMRAKARSAQLQDELLYRKNSGLNQMGFWTGNGWVPKK